MMSFNSHGGRGGEEQEPSINVCGCEVPLNAYWTIIELWDQGSPTASIVQQVIRITRCRSIHLVEHIVNHVIDNQILMKNQPAGLQSKSDILQQACPANLSHPDTTPKDTVEALVCSPAEISSELMTLDAKAYTPPKPVPSKRRRPAITVVTENINDDDARPALIEEITATAAATVATATTTTANHNNTLAPDNTKRLEVRDLRRKNSKVTLPKSPRPEPKEGRVVKPLGHHSRDSDEDWLHKTAALLDRTDSSKLRNQSVDSAFKTARDNADPNGKIKVRRHDKHRNQSVDSALPHGMGPCRAPAPMTPRHTRMATIASPTAVRIPVNKVTEEVAKPSCAHFTPISVSLPDHWSVLRRGIGGTMTSRL